MTRLLITAVAALVLVALLPLLPLLAEPVRPRPATVPAASPLQRQTVASLRAIARRRGLRTVAGVPVAAARKSALLAVLA